MVCGVSFIAGCTDRDDARRIAVACQRQRDGKRPGVASLISTKSQTDHKRFSLTGCGFVQKTHGGKKIILLKDGSVGGDKIKIF